MDSVVLFFIHVWFNPNDKMRLSISLSHQGPVRKPKLIEQGVTIFAKLNDLNAEKNPMFQTLSSINSFLDDNCITTTDNSVQLTWWLR